MAKIGLGVVVAQIRGKVGGGVFTRAKNGATLRVRVTPSNPNTAAQSAIRSDLTDASRAYKSLGSSDAADWAAYALGITKYNPISGSHYHPSAINVFVGLATKFLQATPGGTIPTSPPATPFEGDTITVAATGGSGSITYTGSGDNDTGITTEVLYQKLSSANAQPKPNGYKHGAFDATPDATPPVVSGLAAGVYSPAYRFVELATGQASGLVVGAPVTVS